MVGRDNHINPIQYVSGSHDPDKAIKEVKEKQARLAQFAENQYIK